MNQVQPTETSAAPAVPEIIELNDLKDFAHFVCVQARVQLGEDAYAAYVEANRAVAAHREAAVDAYFGGSTQQMADARQGLAQAQARVDNFNVKIDDTAWIGFAEQQQRAIQQQQFEQALRDQHDEHSQENTSMPQTSTSRKAKKAGFVVLRGGKQAKTKKPMPTLVDFFSSDSQNEKSA